MAETKKGSVSSVCYSIEIKDAYIPPWIISTVCDAMSSQGSSFEARYGKCFTVANYFLVVDHVDAIF